MILSAAHATPAAIDSNFILWFSLDLIRLDG
jgi:hypothetical protein